MSVPTIQGVKVLVVVHQIIPELVGFGSLAADQRLLHVFDPRAKFPLSASLVVVSQIGLVRERLQADQGILPELLLAVVFDLLSGHDQHSSEDVQNVVNVSRLIREV